MPNDLFLSIGGHNKIISAVRHRSELNWEKHLTWWISVLGEEAPQTGGLALPVTPGLPVYSS